MARGTITALILSAGMAALTVDADAQVSQPVSCLTILIGRMDAPLMAAGMDSLRIRAIASARLGHLGVATGDTTTPGCHEAKMLTIDASVSRGLVSPDYWATMSGRLTRRCGANLTEDCGVLWEYAPPSFQLKSRRHTLVLLDARLTMLFDDLANYLTPSETPPSPISPAESRDLAPSLRSFHLAPASIP